VGASTTLWSGLRVYGDVSARNPLTNNGKIYGDVFASTFAGTGTKTGQLNPQTLSLDWPPVMAGYVNASYPTRLLADGVLLAGSYQPDSIWRCAGDLDITGTVTIKGMLLVGGNLTIRNSASGSQMLAAKNLPALYVGGKLIIESINGLQIEGLVVVDHDVRINTPASNISIVGGLFVGGELNQDGPGPSLTIIADPVRAAIVEGATGSQTSWSPAVGGFFKSIRRWQ
jgi:hypothetical protein